MPRGEYTGNVRKAKRKLKIQRMIEVYPDESERLNSMIASINDELRLGGACLYCGRTLSDGDEILGSDCRKHMESDGTLEEWLRCNLV